MVSRQTASTLIGRLSRKKIVDFGDSELRRVLTLVDLTFLGVGSTIGVGFYVLVGNVARSIAGPAVVISFLVAGIASVFAGLCYAEFGARVPKAGSAYIYSYVCIGECVAFVIGWNLVLEYIIGASSVARGFSGYIDALGNHVMSDGLKEVMPIGPAALSDYPDFLSFALIFLLSILLALGIKESSAFNNVFSSLNMVIVIYVIIIAATEVDVHNWNLTKNETLMICNDTDSSNKNYPGEGGFSPYGFSGIMRGAATCFFGFVGFDCIATTGEEAINPSRNIPLSISISLIIIFLAYFGISSTITLALPYCLQDPDAALVSFFEIKDMQVSKWIVSIGALFGFSASLIGVLLPLPRIIYAMANDGIIFRFLAVVNKRFKTPFLATMVSGTIAGAIAMIFDLEALVDMMSIGTLMAYTIVAVSVMLLRYVPENEEPNSLMESSGVPKRKSISSVQSYSTKDIAKQLLNLPRLTDPTELSGSIASYATLTFCVLVAALSLMLALLQEELYNGEVGAIVGVVIVALLNIGNVIIIGFQPESKAKLSFKVPFVPWMPALSSLINVYLMFNLSSDTWIRFAVWMAIGMPIYFFYGMWQSTEELRSKGKDKFGIDNPGGPTGDDKDLLFVIPEINVQFATPMNSEPGTPKTFHKMKKEVRPISPLALEKELKTMEGQEDPKSGQGSTSQNGVQHVLETLDKLVEGSLTMTKTSEVLQESAQHKGDISNQPDVQLRELPPLPPNISEVRISDQADSAEESKYVSVINERSTIDQDKSSDGESPSNPQYETLEEVKDKVEEIETQKDDSHSVKSAVVLSELLKKVPKVDDMDDSKEEEEEESLYDKINKDAKRKPDPLDLTFANISDSRSSSLKSSRSAPMMPSSSPPTPNTMDARSPRGSVPSTPNSRRHPTKILKRNASFDEIPPSSLESPLVRRVNKFFIIPVQEPDLSDSENSSPLPSPSTTIHSEDKDDKGQEDLMLEMKRKFNNLYDQERENQDEDSPKSGKMFYVESDESLENMNISGDLPSPTSPSQIRELKRVANKDAFFLGEGLDTIRERGESKIYTEEAHKDVLNHLVMNTSTETSNNTPTRNSQETETAVIEENPDKSSAEGVSKLIDETLNKSSDETVTERNEIVPNESKEEEEDKAETGKTEAQIPSTTQPPANSEKGDQVKRLKALFGS